MPLSLPYGATRSLPANVRVAWGARLIFPADLLWDRQGCAGGEDGCAERSELLAWLSAGAGDAARAEARRLARDGWTSRDDDTRVLYDDGVGRIVGNPQGSGGYLYVAAWLYSHVTEED